MFYPLILNDKKAIFTTEKLQNALVKMTDCKKSDLLRERIGNDINGSRYESLETNRAECMSSI